MKANIIFEIKFNLHSNSAVVTSHEPNSLGSCYQLMLMSASVANSDFTMSLQADQNVPTLAIKVPTFSLD